jgi:hypothetical protein
MHEEFEDDLDAAEDDLCPHGYGFDEWCDDCDVFDDDEVTSR